MARPSAQQDSGQTAAHETAPPGTEGLGQLRATFLPKRTSAGRLAGQVVMGIIALIFPPMAVYFFWIIFQSPNFSRKQAARRLYFFEQGLAEVGKTGEVSVFRWDAMTVLQEITQRYANGVYVGTTYVYTLHGADGKSLQVTNFYAEPERWGPAVQQEIIRVQLPWMLAQLQQGQILAFGGISVNLGGVAASGGSLTWPEIEKVNVDHGVLYLRKHGKKLAWATTPVKKIPNLFLFLALVDQLRQGALPRNATPGWQ